MEIEQPKFDELAPGLSDVEEVGDAILDRSHYQQIAKLGVTAGTYWYALREMGVPKKDATTLTIEWMHICEGTDA